MAAVGDRTFTLEEALKAQQALREAAGLAQEEFPVQAFVGMISDEVQALRERGLNDESIVRIIAENSAITIRAEEIAAYYASPEERQHGEH